MMMLFMLFVLFSTVFTMFISSSMLIPVLRFRFTVSLFMII
jgi:hypothetical protein